VFAARPDKVLLWLVPSVFVPLLPVESAVVVPYLTLSFALSSVVQETTALWFVIADVDTAEMTGFTVSGPPPDSLARAKIVMFEKYK
jgi:hypothetical protein